jgi:pimeloyl-ACP methyl ester carboxylesterase
MEMFADDAVGVLVELKINRAHVFGVSMGGMIAQEFALRHPARTVTLTLGCTTAGGQHSVPPLPESMKVLTAPRVGVSPEEIIRRGWPLSYTPDYIEKNRTKLEAAIPRLLKHPTPPFAFQLQLEATYTLKTWDRLPEISAPTLVITGAQDCLIPARNSELLAERIPGATLHLIQDVGHAFMNQSPREFLSVFVPFVKQHRVI